MRTQLTTDGENFSRFSLLRNRSVVVACREFSRYTIAVISLMFIYKTDGKAKDEKAFEQLTSFAYMCELGLKSNEAPFRETDGLSGCKLD